MTELPPPPTPRVSAHGDSVSQLLQVQASMAGLKRSWTGKGAEDARRVMADLANAQRLKEVLWKGLGELFDMPELKTFPERVQAQMMSIILNAKANAELDKKA